jgi:hypothetical protein
MYRMLGQHVDRNGGFILPAICVVLGLGLGCGRQEGQHPADAPDAVVAQALPFHPDSNALESDGAQPGVPTATDSADHRPFQSGSRSDIMPSGTLLMVQLIDPLSAGRRSGPQEFTATVAAPLTIGGETLIDNGVKVAGCIESARYVKDRNSSLAYLRLKLTAITIGDRDLPLQTSSLFVRASVQAPTSGSGSQTLCVQKGRRLTFRLTAPLPLGEPPGVPNPKRLGAAG